MRVFTVFIIVSLFCLGCKENDKESVPTDSISEEEFYSQEEDLKEALEELYNSMNKDNLDSYYGYNFILIGDVTSDITKSLGQIYNELDSYIYGNKKDPFYSLYHQAGIVISLSNNIIEVLSDLQGIDQTTKDQILGETYFLRGLAYFDLTRSFGGVPHVAGKKGIYDIDIIHKQEIRNSNRLSLEESYNQVETNLKKAIDLLPSSFSTPTKASEASAKALVARLYLYTQDFDKAEQHATEVIEDSPFNLVEDYTSIFNQGDTKETIFKLNLNSNQEGPGGWYVPDSHWRYDSLAFHNQFVALVQSRPEDKRNQLIDKHNVGDVNFYYPVKYDTGNNVQILRIAEMYLVRAEARVRKSTPDLSGALLDLNKIRNRVGLADTSGTGLDTASEILEAIELERSIEFMGEGHRWFDLVRTGRALDVFTDIERTNGNTVSLQDEYKLVFPLPVGLEQNVGY